MKLSKNELPPIGYFFSDWSEEYFEDRLIFRGKARESAKSLSDYDLILAIDGGRINKSFKINKDGDFFEVVIYLFTLEEISKIPDLWEYKFGGSLGRYKGLEKG